jgi:hypothetical protein
VIFIRLGCSASRVNTFVGCTHASDSGRTSAGYGQGCSAIHSREVQTVLVLVGTGHSEIPPNPRHSGYLTGLHVTVPAASKHCPMWTLVKPEDRRTLSHGPGASMEGPSALQQTDHWQCNFKFAHSLYNSGLGVFTTLPVEVYNPGVITQQYNSGNSSLRRHSESLLTRICHWQLEWYNFELPLKLLRGTVSGLHHGFSFK